MKLPSTRGAVLLFLVPCAAVAAACVNLVGLRDVPDVADASGTSAETGALEAAASDDGGDGAAEAATPCTTVDQCPAPLDDCTQATCVGGVCGRQAAPSTTIPSQVTGDCAKNVCSGETLVAVADDTDIPVATGVCKTFGCAGGTPSTHIASAGTTCSDNGGVTCDGAGNCEQPFVMVRVGTSPPLLGDGGLGPAIEADAGALAPDGGDAGDGNPGALSAAAAPVFLDTFDPEEGAAPFESVSMPVAAVGTNQPFTLTGISTTEGALTRSEDGHFVVLAGYGIPPGGNTDATTTPRVLATLDVNGRIDTSTVLPTAAFAGSSIRGAASLDGHEFWASGTSLSATAGGLWYASPGDGGVAAQQILAVPNNMRTVSLFDGQLYGVSASSALLGVFAVGAGAPTATGQAGTPLTGAVTNNGQAAFLLDLDPNVAGPDTIYLADGTGLLRFTTTDGKAWTQDPNFPTLLTSCLGVAAKATPAGVIVVASNSTTVLRVDVPTSGPVTATTLFTAAPGTAFRGVALAPTKQ